MRFLLNTARQKVKHPQVRPGTAFLVRNPNSPYRAIEVRSRVEPEPDQACAFADQVGAKYGADLRTWHRPGEQRVGVLPCARPE